MEKTKKHFLRRAALLLAMLTLASAVMVGCGGKKEPEKDPKDDEVIVKPEPVVLPEGVSFDEKKYPDVFGFMQVPNASQCAISKGHYLAQSPKSAKSETGYDDDYYLNRDLDGVTNKAGSLYIQAHYNKSDLSDPVTVIYGHNMANRTMFGGLQSHIEAADLASTEEYFYVYLPGRILTYRVVGGAPGDDAHILYYNDFSDPTGFSNYFGNLYAQSGEHVNLPGLLRPSPDDRVVVLATCMNGEKYLRYLIIGVLTDDTGN